MGEINHIFDQMLMCIPGRYFNTIQKFCNYNQLILFQFLKILVPLFESLDIFFELSIPPD